MMQPQRITVKDTQWDRIARKGIITIGNKELLDITFAPLIATEREMKLYLKTVRTYKLPHEHAFIIKQYRAAKTIKPIIRAAESADLLLTDFSIKNTVANDFLASNVIIVDPAPEAILYEKYTEEMGQSQDVSLEFRRLANRISAIDKTKPKKKEGQAAYSTRKYDTYQEFWRSIMDEKNRGKLVRLIADTFDKEAACRASVGLAHVPVTYSLEMLEYTKEINRIALANWPKGQPSDNCATYIVLQSTVLRNTLIMDAVIDYIKNAPTKFIVLKFKNLELDLRTRMEEQDAFKNLMKVIIEIKKKDNDKVFVLLEAGYQLYAAAASGFDIVSTAMTGFDDDWPFRKGNTGINGWFDVANLIFQNDKVIKKMLENGGLRHAGCPVCTKIKDYETAKKQWYSKKRMHYMWAVNELFARLYTYIKEQQIERAKADIIRSRVANLRHILPDLDHL
jgi:hypothetical protein